LIVTEDNSKDLKVAVGVKKRGLVKDLMLRVRILREKSRETGRYDNVVYQEKMKEEYYER